MLNWIWMGLIVVGVLVAGLLGQLSGSNGIVEGLFSLIEVGIVGIVIPLSATIMLWLGIMRLAEKSGMVEMLARVVRPIMKRLFPDVPPEHPAMGAMIMNMAANMLGVGNAATALGLKAMQHLEELNKHRGTATNAMCTFLAINTSSITLVPATTIGLLATQGVAQPYAIVGTTIGATVFSTIVAIIAVKFFEKLPAFQIREVEEGEEVDSEDEEAQASPSAKRRLSPFARVMLVVVFLLFGWMVAFEAYPQLRTSAQEMLGLREIAEALDAPKASLKASDEERVLPDWQRLVMGVSVTAIPFVLVFFILVAALKRIPVYEEFVEGAKEGWAVAVRMMPFIVAMLAALAIFRNSGALYLLQLAMAPVLEFLRFPPDLVPMALMRPLSGSGSKGILIEIITNDGLTEAVKFAAATMYGSTETTFYVLAVYFGSVAIRRTRHALAAGLCADAAGVIAAVVICQAFFG